MKNGHVLITGGTGLIGSRLTTLLQQKGYVVSHLSRTTKKAGIIPTRQWDIEKNSIDSNALNDIDYVIHLAGENIAAGRWTKSFKKKIRESRVKSSSLLRQAINAHGTIKAIICASAIGIYKDEIDNWINESSLHDTGFLAWTCKEWEEANSHYTCRTVILRTGLVLAKNGGALPELIKPLRFGAAPYFGNGLFYQSWIHIDDLCLLYIFALQNGSMHGTYNAVAPNPVTNYEFTTTLQHMARHFTIRFPVPDLLLKIALGQKAKIVNSGSRVSAQKTLYAGYEFIYKKLEHALASILEK